MEVADGAVLPSGALPIGSLAVPQQEGSGGDSGGGGLGSPVLARLHRSLPLEGHRTVILASLTIILLDDPHFFLALLSDVLRLHFVFRPAQYPGGYTRYLIVFHVLEGGVPESLEALLRAGGTEWQGLGEGSRRL